MSNQDDKKRKPDITVEIDRSSELREVEEENARLKIEKENAEETLRLLAEKEFEAKCHSVGLNPKETTPEILKDELRKKAPHGGDTLSWSQAIGEKDEDPRAQKDLSSILVDDTKQGLENAIEFLNFKKSHGTQSEKEEARKLLAVAEKRIFSKNKQLLDVEFSDDIHALTRHELPIRENMTDEEKAKIEQYNSELRRKRANWIQR